MFRRCLTTINEEKFISFDRMNEVMDPSVSQRLLDLQKGDKVQINNQVYIIKGKEIHKAEHEFDLDCTSFDLGNKFFLQQEGDWRFFQIVEKEHLLGFRSGTWNVMPIRNIKILKQL